MKPKRCKKIQRFLTWSVLSGLRGNLPESWQSLGFRAWDFGGLGASPL